MKRARFGQSLLAGLVVGVAGMLGAALLFGAIWVAATVFKTSRGPVDEMGRLNYLIVAGVGLGAFAGGGLGWWLLAADRPSAMRGLLVGVAAGIAGHPAAWFLILWLDGSGWKELLVKPLMTGAFSLLIVGWLTVPLPALAGAALGRWHAVKDDGHG